MNWNSCNTVRPSHVPRRGTPCFDPARRVVRGHTAEADPDFTLRNANNDPRTVFLKGAMMLINAKDLASFPIVMVAHGWFEAESPCSAKSASLVYRG